MSHLDEVNADIAHAARTLKQQLRTIDTVRPDPLNPTDRWFLERFTQVRVHSATDSSTLSGTPDAIDDFLEPL